MKYNRLGRTDAEVSAIGFGSWGIGGVDWGPTDDGESRAAIDAAVESGISFFDTADAYGGGHSEELLGEMLSGRRDKVFLASKGGILPGLKEQDFSAKWLRTALEGSLRRLRTDRVDLYYLHNPLPEHMHNGECFEALERFVEEGKIRAWGVSVRPPAGNWRTPPSGASGDPIDDARLAMKLARPHAIQLVFSMVEMRALTLFEQAEKAGVAIVSRVPLARGLLSGRFTADTTFPEGDFRQAWPREQLLKDVELVEQLKAIVEPEGFSILEAALAFPVSFPQVAATIPGARNARQARSNAAAADKAPLSAAALQKIRHLIGV